MSCAVGSLPRRRELKCFSATPATPMKLLLKLSSWKQEGNRRGDNCNSLRIIFDRKDWTFSWTSRTSKTRKGSRKESEREEYAHTCIGIQCNPQKIHASEMDSTLVHWKGGNYVDTTFPSRTHEPNRTQLNILVEVYIYEQPSVRQALCATGHRCQQNPRSGARSRCLNV